jgi:DNA-binding NarL/FixJ family response regulator
MTMPDLDGAETMRELRHVRPSLRVVLSSGYEEVEATRRMQKMDHAGFLQKPYLPTDLAAIVKAALAKAALAR